MEGAVIREDNETVRQNLITLVNNGLSTRKEVTVSGYDESTNTIEKSVVVTVQGNYTADEVEANPQLAQQAELDITFKSESGQILFSKTFTADNYDSVGKPSTARAFSCYGDCMGNFGYLDSWVYGYTSALGGFAGSFASSNLVGALLGGSTVIGVHSGCFYGCVGSWIWYDVL
jgi:hypothetical protein